MNLLVIQIHHIYHTNGHQLGHTEQILQFQKLGTINELLFILELLSQLSICGLTEKRWAILKAQKLQQNGILHNT